MGTQIRNSANENISAWRDNFLVEQGDEVRSDGKRFCSYIGVIEALFDHFYKIYIYQNKKLYSKLRC